MKKFVIVCVLVMLTTVTSGLYIKDLKDEDSSNGQFSDIIKSWNNYKSKTSQTHKSQEQDSVDFKELEVLEMIPTIIDRLRQNEMSDDDIKIMSELYGTFWPLIVQEAERKTNDEMNALLKSLLKSFSLTKDITNDIDHNTVDVRTSTVKPKENRQLSLKLNENDHPSQRVLKTAAMLIHQYSNTKNQNGNPRTFNNNRRYLRNRPKRTTLNLKLTNIPITDINRTKRHLNIRVNGNEMSPPNVDTLLKMFRQRHGIESNESKDEYDDEQMIGGGGGNAEQLELDGRDYMYDNLYEDDEEDTSSTVNLGHNSDFGSFQDLILMAANNRLRREHEETKLKQQRNPHFI